MYIQCGIRTFILQPGITLTLKVIKFLIKRYLCAVRIDHHRDLTSNIKSRFIAVYPLYNCPDETLKWFKSLY